MDGRDTRVLWRKALVSGEGLDSGCRSYGERGEATVRGTGVTSAAARAARISADSCLVHIDVYDDRPDRSCASAAAAAGSSGFAVGCYCAAADCDCPTRAVGTRVVSAAADARQLPWPEAVIIPPIMLTAPPAPSSVFVGGASPLSLCLLRHTSRRWLLPCRQ